MPGPVLNLGRSLLGSQATLPALGAAVALVLCIPLLVLGGRRIWGHRHEIALEKPTGRLLSVILLWVVLHNLAYALFLPHIGAAGRYAPMNQILFWVALAIGAWSIRSRAPQAIAIGLVVALVGVSLAAWQEIYSANIEFSRRVRIAAARYVDTHVPSQALVGATDLGPIRYFARQPVVDLLGHVNREIGPFREAGYGFGDYLQREGICYLMLFGAVGEAGLDFADEMGLANDVRFDLVPEARFAVPVSAWRLGSGPLRNYMPAMEVYRIAWHTPGVCESYLGAD
jgi:hypothetical protein